MTIQIVGWNSAAALPRLLDSLASIPTTEVAITYIDNASTDASVELVREQLPHASIIELPHNVGFGGAHNIGFRRITTEFVAIVNPDVKLNWKDTQKLFSSFSDSRVAAVQGKLLRQTSPAIIDSVGITQTISLNGRERGAGEVDAGQYEVQIDLLATTGAFSIYRMKALTAVAYGTYRIGEHEALEVFDKEFFAYKEDVDLGWRLKNASWKSIYVPVFVATHERNLRHQGIAGTGLRPSAIWNRIRNPRTRLSFRNYCWMILKNASIVQLLLRSVFIFTRSLTFILLIFISPSLLQTWIDIFRGMSKMVKKRYEPHNHHS